MYSCGRFQSCTVILYLFIIELKKIQRNNHKEFTIWHMLGAKTIGANNEFWGKRVNWGLQNLGCLRGTVGTNLGVDKLFGAGQVQ